MVALLLMRGAIAETVTDSAALTRAQLDMPGYLVALNAVDASPTTVRTVHVELRFDEDALAPAGGNAWTYTVVYRVKLGSNLSPARSLTLFRGVDRNVFRAVDRIGPINSATAGLQIVSTSSSDMAAVPTGVELNARIESVRYTAFARNAQPSLTRTSGSAPLLQWAAVAGAEEYEIESVFVDAREPAVSGSPFSRRVPVRFQTRGRETPIDGYRSAGTVHYRVRAVGRHASDPSARRFGAWSATLAVPLAASGFESDKNWSYERRYDGEGPAQGMMSYFDGGLRLRQAQSGAPDRAQRLIAETKFDHEGRAAVNFLAAPEAGAQMTHAPAFNRAADGTAYGPEHFDRDGVVAAATSSGAGRYFSGANDGADAFSPYLPDAGGYPFSVAEHKRDDSARLAAMSGFGAKTRLGQGHDNIYVYGDAADPHLRPLFGPNLGDVRHYERTLSGDGNRSFEVSYRDGSDHIIAQSVIGDVPPNLADLPNAPAPALQSVSMDANNRVDAAAGRNTLNYRIANAVNTSYFFAYSPTGVDYSAYLADARFPPLCESCRYRLRIRVVGPDGAPVQLARSSTPQNDPNCSGLTAGDLSSGIDQVIENPNPPSCPVGGPDYTRGYTVPPIRFCARLTEPGEYEVQKTLEFVDGDIDASISDYQEKPGFFAIDGFVDTPDPASCGETCLQHCAAAIGVNPAATPNDPQLTQCVAQCQNPQGWVMDRVDANKCDTLENTLARDMAPGGRHHRANATTADHPEYCHVGVCRTMQPSDRYDLEMGAVDTYDEALCKGYLNPTSLASAANGPPTLPTSCTATPARDPFFAPGGEGAARRTTLNTWLNDFTSTIPDWADPVALSLWQFAADPRVNSVGSGAGPTPDEQWRLFRSLYLGAKKRLVIQHTEDPAGFNCPFSPASDARVPKPPLPRTVVEVIDAISDTTAQQCGTICAARVDGWMRELSASCPGALDPARVRQSLDAYCASSCGANNPLASLIGDDIAAGDLNLAAALAALGPGCSLDGIAVEDPYVYQTVCGETCCNDRGPSECTRNLITALRERLPPAAATVSIRDTPAGESFRSCLDWVDHLSFRSRFIELQSKPEDRACRVVFVAPDGKVLPTAGLRIVGAPEANANPPPGGAGAGGMPYTGLTVEVEINGATVTAAIYSDCALTWTGKLDMPACRTEVISTPPPTSCRKPPDGRRTPRLSYVPRPESCPAQPIPGSKSGYASRPVSQSPPVKPPRSSCPRCLDDLEVLLEERKYAELATLRHGEGSCLLSLKPEGNRFMAEQPGSRRCSVYLVDRTGQAVILSTIASFEQVVRDAPLPGGLSGPGGTRYMGAAIWVQKQGAGRDILFAFTDCELLSSEICGGGCTPITRPPSCLTSVLAEIARLHAPIKGRKPDDRKPAPGECFDKLKVDKSGANFVLGTKRCRLMLIDADGGVRPPAKLGTGTLRWVGTIPERGAYGSMRFTGYVLVMAQGIELGLYSDCETPADNGCVTIVVDVEDPIPPPVDTPVNVCLTAVNEAAGDRARLEVERARDEFATEFKSVHYNRCFGSELRESFGYQARNREYHFTLRYYDQADNLVQTVPPEGVTAAATGAPAHRMVSRFRYNSLEQIVAQSTPDTGERTFIYDRANRLRFSQSAQQRVDGAFAYVRYDGLGRNIEAGLVRGLGEAVIRARVDENGFPAATDGALEQVARTVYDSATGVGPCASIAPHNLRGRVAAVIAASSVGMSTLCYSYDVAGRTEAVLRDLPGLGAKTIHYDYDALSGRIAALHYQRGQSDAWHQRYTFNRSNEIETVESSRDGVVWDRDARYQYFAHGPVARVELGGDRVQGLDFTYTIDGLPKGLNTGTLTEARDPGRDGLPGAANSGVMRDVAGQTLEFFAGDYSPVGLGAGTLNASASPHSSAVNNGSASALAMASCAPVTVADGCGLFEGNLARSVLGLEGLDGFARITGFAYRYDRLYRLREASSHAGLDQVTHLWPTTASTSLWRNALTYDSNGNIRTLSRTALSAATPTPSTASMDELVYRYASDTQGRLMANRLEHLNDTVPDAAFGADLDDQGSYSPLNLGTHNYVYDANGNLIRDRSAGITAVLWNMSDRVTEVELADERLEFLYDALGQRFAKIRKPSSDPASWETEHFVRDENGKLLATYRTTPAATPPAPVLEELYLRGAGDIGVLRVDDPLPMSLPAGTFRQVRGEKQYQISNYLGHVLATVSDRRRPVLDAGGAITGFEPWILSTTDYDPFGAPSPGRFEEAQAYRFGFNGYERDDELKGAGNSYYTHERLFDPRLGRWLSPDPIQLAHSSPYAGFSNNPLRFGDPRGQVDWDSFKDTMENVAITARDIGRDAAYVFSGAAVADAVADNLVKAKSAYDQGQTSEAVAHAIGIQGAIESLAQKDLDWQEGGATVEDRIRMGIGEVSGMNDVARAVTGETEFAEQLTTAERVQLGIQGGVKVVTIAAQGASIATSMIPKSPGGTAAAKPSVKSPGGPGCPMSFAPETVIWTAAGPSRIDEVAPQTLIRSLHPESGDVGEFAVTDVSISSHIDGLRLVLESADGRVDVLTTTREHPFWLVGTGWVDGGELRVGDEVHSDSGDLLVRELARIEARFDAYNLSVDDAETYLVGELGVWVHNCKRPPHRATMTTKNKSGEVTHRNKLVSGGSNKGRRLTFKEQGEVHTEAKGTKQTRKRIKSGEDVGSLTFKGELPPCSMCKGKMNKLHREKGVPSTYRDTKTGGTWKSSGQTTPKKKK